jgi:hypothetical protein
LLHISSQLSFKIEIITKSKCPHGFQNGELKKMIACLLIVRMFLRLPKAEAVAEDKVDDFVAATIGFD